MFGIKKTFQDNLSLSSKLFLKEAIYTSEQLITTCWEAVTSLAIRLANIAYRQGINLPQNLIYPTYPLAPPTLASDDLISSARTLASKVHQKTETAIHTSIIIPVFNKAPFTLQCLRSLEEEVDLNGVEIIVVNNASTDETERILSELNKLVRVINNKKNEGFVDACNRGAATARGKYLVFLNNDTKVSQGWLKQLLDTVEASDSVGAVGSMFLYPDGSIQEAGAFVWRNGESHHYGWGHSPDDKRFNFAREVDYCSAASLLIRKEVFQRLGGFDRRFAPAYYEDVDICFGVRSLGYKVVYQPMSRLVHYEGATAGADTNKGVKQFQIINRHKFVEKWGELLEQEQLERDFKQLDEAANRNRERPHVVVFDERIPSPDRDAGSARMFMILKALAKWSNVVFVPFNRPQGINYEEALWKEGVETANAVDYRRLLKRKNLQAAIVSRPSVAEAMIPRIRRINGNVRIVFDMVDVHFLRLEREYRIAADERTAKEAKHYRTLELSLARASDVTWCASPEERSLLESETRHSRIEVVPTIHPLRSIGKPFEEREHLLFIGNFVHSPNKDAVHYFIRDIFPLVQTFLPDVRVCIVGDNVPAEISSYASSKIQIMGYVPKIEPLLQSSRILIAPLRFGAGIKGKIGEAMAAGLPVVTTTIGAEGFGLAHLSNVLIADDPGTFAGAVAQLYSGKELWESLAQNSRSHIAKYFTPEVVAETIKKSIRQARSDR